MDIFIKHGINIIWLFLELLSLYIFSNSFLRQKREKHQRYLSFAVIWLILSIYICLGRITIPLPMLTCGLGIPWAFFLFQGSWLRKLCTVILACILSLAVDYGVCHGACLLMGIHFRQLTAYPPLYYIVLTTARLIQLLIMYLIHRVRLPDFSQFLYGKWLFLTLLFPGISLIIIVVVFFTLKDGSDLSSSVILTCGILAAANIVVLYLIHTAEKTTKTDTELMLLNKQMDIQTQSILSLEKSYRAQRKVTHEFRHHLQTIHDLLTQGETDTAREYVMQLQETHSTRILCVNSHHPIIDAILNQKYQLATEQSIDVQIQVNDLSGLRIGTEALVVLLTNLLDNAIEACQRLQDTRCIRCSILLDDTLFISIRNTTLPVKIEENAIKTTKMPKQDHGYGLPGIRLVLEQLKAEYTFEYSDGWFQFAAEIPLTK